MKQFIKSKKGITTIFLGLGICFLLTFIIVFNNKMYNTGSNDEQLINVAAVNSNEFIYLSDIDYDPKNSKSGWGSLLKDKTSSGTKISIKYENSTFSFDKGMWAHASSVLQYDLTNYTKYKYFTTFVGVNTTAGGNGNGVKFYIYTSKDGKTWDLKTEENPTVLKGNTNAIYYQINLDGAKYLRLVANDNGANGNDHSVYADAKLTNNIEDENVVKSVEYYDNLIKTKYANADFSNQEYELLVLQRNLVKNAGQYTIKVFCDESDANKTAFQWLFNNLENLKMYTLGGKPDGAYIKSLKVLSNLYAKYKDDFTNKEVTKYGTVYGDLYKRMAITLSLTHSINVGLWMQPTAPENKSDAVDRYQIYKDLHKNNKFVVSSRQDHTKWFEALKVEEMRYVLNNIIDDEEILWLNEYTQKYIDAHPNKEEEYLQPHHYMKYIWPNYGKAEYHDEKNKEMYSQKYGNFLDYGVTFRPGLYKLWMNLDNGAVCGGISKIGSNIRAVHGTPSAVIGQPGHAAIIYYRKDANGLGYWTIDNDVSGWAQSERGERKPLGWGNDSYAKGYNATYIMMAQEALNHFDAYEKSAKLVLESDIYNDNKTKKEVILRKALKELSYNVDAWWSLIKLYQSDTTKTERDFYNLAEELAESLKAYPLPMYNLTNLLKDNFTSPEYKFKFTLLQTRILKEGSVASPETVDVYQPSITRTVANYLLGKFDSKLATFSFDGENANNIVLSNKFDNNGIRWDYSIDNKNTWKEVTFMADEPHKHQLTTKEIASITEDNDIYIHIVGTSYDEKNLYKIDITKATLPQVYANDLENRVIGVTTAIEWRLKDTDNWTSYQDASPNLTGDKTVEIRVGANKTSLPSDSAKYTFTKDTDPDSRKYIPVSHLSVESVSSEATAQKGNATYSIDGNYYTRWHSAWNGSDTNRYITIKLDKPVYLSAVEFVPAGGGNGKIIDGTIYGSIDGENWEVLTTVKNLKYTGNVNAEDHGFKNIKDFNIDTPKEVQYVKIVADKASNGNWFAARMFNFYQDITKNPHPTAGIGYSTTEPTNEPVIARLINPSTKIKILNNNGSDSYTFHENGKFTFEFIDEETNKKGSSTATVTWIDKKAPIGTITYSKTSLTNTDVVAKLKTNEDVTILSEGVNASDKEDRTYEYTFTKNGSYTFKFKDKAGNIGNAVANVTWIDKESPIGTISYNTTNLTNKPVTATISFNKGVKILNNNGKDTYTFTKNGEFTFEFIDEAGNRGSKTVSVDWIVSIAPKVELTYSTNKKTSNPVVVTISSKEKIKIINNNGKNTYTFTKNGSFKFIYEDELGLTYETIARVNWINESTSSDNNHKEENNKGENNSNLNKKDPNNNTKDEDKKTFDFQVNPVKTEKSQTNNNQNNNSNTELNKEETNTEKNDSNKTENNKEKEVSSVKENNTSEENLAKEVNGTDKKLINILIIILIICGIMTVIFGIKNLKKRY